MQAHRRHDISDRIWENIQAHLPGSKGLVGRPANDNRLFINAVFGVLRTGAPYAAGAVGGNQAISRTKGGSTQRYIWPWIRMVCRNPGYGRNLQCCF